MNEWEKGLRRVREGSERGQGCGAAGAAGAGSGRHPKLSGYALTGAVRTSRHVGVANLGGSHVPCLAPAEYRRSTESPAMTQTQSNTIKRTDADAQRHDKA